MGMSAVDPQFHVLAVDDSLIDRKLIERLLKTSSYQVTTVDSGSKALEVLGWHEDERINSNESFVSQEVEVNLVITDYCMPGMTGYDLLKKIKESSYLRNIPVVIMSSENVPSRINSCLEEGAEEFFLKPVRLSDVNKLRPYIMKNKICEDFQKSENQEIDETTEETQSENRENEESKKEDQSDNINVNININNNNNDNNNNNKRKSSMDEELSPDRRRPKYNGGFSVMSN